MTLNTNMTLPSLLPTTAALPLPACALPAIALPVDAAPVALPAEWAFASLVSVPQVHQVRAQAELGNMALVLGNGNMGTTGFKGSDSISRKRYTDGGSGVPPRGRPV